MSDGQQKPERDGDCGLCSVHWDFSHVRWASVSVCKDLSLTSTKTMDMNTKKEPGLHCSSCFGEHLLLSCFVMHLQAS